MFDVLFSLANGVVIFWLLLIFLPKWRVTQYLVDKKIIPLYLALLYTLGIVVIIVQNGFRFVNDFGSAEGVIHLLSDPHLALLCWIHLLCFDLFVGHYIFQDNGKNKNLPLALQSLILFFTLMFGPFGFLCYRVADMIGKRKKSVAK